MIQKIRLFVRKSSYFAWLRILIVMGVSLRVATGFVNEAITTEQVSEWTIVIFVFSLYAIAIFLGERYAASVFNSERSRIAQIFIDAILVTWLYYFNQNPDSDFYLFYFLPLLLAAETLERYRLRIAFVIMSGLFAIALAAASLTFMAATTPPQLALTTILNNILARVTFFILVIYLASRRWSLLRKQVQELEAVHQTALRILQKEDLQYRLDLLLDATSQLLRASGSKVYLQSSSQGPLKLIALKGLDNEQFKVGYTLQPGAGLAGQVLLQKKTLVENNYSTSKYRVSELECLFDKVLESPLVIGDQYIGVVGVFDPKSKRPFSIESDGPVLERLSRFAAIAIRDMQLVRELKEQSQVSRVVLDAAEHMMRAHLNLENTLSSLAKSAWDLACVFVAQPPLYTYIALLDSDANRVTIIAACPPNELLGLRDRIDHIDLNQKKVGIIGRAILTKEPQNVADVTYDSDYLIYSAETRSQLSVPILFGNKCLGAISLEHSQLNAFPDALQGNVSILASLAGAAIANINSFQQITFQRDQSERLREASNMVSRQFAQPKEIAEAVLSGLHHVVPFDRATLQQVLGKARAILATYKFGETQIDNSLLLPITDDRLIAKIVATKDIIYLAKTNDDPFWELKPTTKDVKSWLGIPLVYSDKVLGLITVDWTSHQSLNADQQRIIKLFANQAASALQNSILFNDLKSKVDEITRVKENLENLVGYYEGYRNLATIGLIYGEDLHFASAELGMARTWAKDIGDGVYDDNLDRLKEMATLVNKTMEKYLNKVKEIRNNTITQITPSPLDIHELLKDVVASKRISREIKIQQNFRARNRVIKAPEMQLRQVFHVVLNNAISAMSSGIGELSIDTQSIDYKGQPAIRVSISDTGQGIPLHLQATLFRAKLISPDSPRRTGGQGLMWAYAFVRSYNGNMSFDSKPGRGTTMYIDLPEEFHEPVFIKATSGAV
jgi:GAF domain-containing protein